jgi:hypothetical protein
MKLQQAQFDAILAKAKQDAKIAMEDADTAASINRSTAESRAYTAMDMEKAATEKTDEK